MAPTSKTWLVLAKNLFLLFLFLVVAVFLIRPPLTFSTARAQGEQRERVFEDEIPKNAPIQIKIKKEKERAFKDLKDESWVREFELEVKNTGNKPIYLIFIDLITDVKVGGYPLVFSLVYGRSELGDLVTKAGPDDVPIKPGETYVFKIHPGQVPAWEQSLRRKSHPDATTIKARIEMLSFGDGTGYFVDHPYPREKRQPIVDDHRQPTNRGGPSSLAWPTRDETRVKSSSIIDMPVTFLPAYFLGRNSLLDCFSQSGEQLEESAGSLTSVFVFIPYLHMFVMIVRIKTGPPPARYSA